MGLGLGLVNSKLDYTVGWEPSDQNDLVLWLKNDIDVSPSMWKNQADLNAPFIQETIGRQPDVSLIPAINSQEKTNDLVFDGVNDGMGIDSGSISVDDAFTFVVVFKPDVAKDVVLTSGSSLSSSISFSPLSVIGNTNVTFLANNVSTIFQHTKAFVSSSSSIPLQYYIIQRSSTGHMTGESSVIGDVNSIIGSPNTEVFNLDKLSGAPKYYDGQIKEVFLFESIFPNSTDYKQIHKYLEHKFGIEEYSS